MLRDCISEWLADPGNGHGTSYGWVKVEEKKPSVYGPLDVEPEPWDCA